MAGLTFKRTKQKKWCNLKVFSQQVKENKELADAE